MQERQSVQARRRFLVDGRTVLTLLALAQLTVDDILGLISDRNSTNESISIAGSQASTEFDFLVEIHNTSVVSTDVATALNTSLVSIGATILNQSSVVVERGVTYTEIP